MGYQPPPPPPSLTAREALIAHNRAVNRAHVASLRSGVAIDQDHDLPRQNWHIRTGPDLGHDFDPILVVAQGPAFLDPPRTFATPSARRSIPKPVPYPEPEPAFDRILGALADALARLIPFPTAAPSAPEPEELWPNL